MPSPLAEAFLMGILNGCYETPSNSLASITPSESTMQYKLRNCDFKAASITYNNLSSPIEIF